jgi:hypothetical protein
MYAIIGFLIFILYVGGKSISSNPILLLVANLAQIPLFLAVASIFSKGILPLTNQFARIFRTATGKIPASLGMRNVSSNDRLVFPVMLILSLMLSSCLINNVVATSIPTTHLIQTRYLIGGDISFRLNNDESAHWNNFSTTVIQQDDVLSVSLVSIGHLSLSEGLSGIVEFIAINPEQYSHVGYGFAGEKLDNSSQTSLLQELEANPEGAVLTTDIATEYNLAPGDILRVFSFGNEPVSAEFNIIGLTTAIPRPEIIGEVISDVAIGTMKIWLNRDYADSFVDLNASAESYLCVRTVDNGNTTKIGMDALAEFEAVLHSSNEWSGTTAELEVLHSLPEYSIDRSIDSMMTINMSLCILVVFATFQVNRRRVDKGKNAMLKLFGANPHLLIRVKIAEIFTIIIVSSIIVLVFTPLNLANSLRIGLQEYSPWSYTFPISIIVVADWITFFVVTMFLLIPSSLLVIALSMRNVDGSIADVLEEMVMEQAYGFTGENI